MLQMHETGRIEGSGRRWANVLAILSDVVYMSFYLVFGCRFARSVTRGKERLWINWAALLSPRCRIEVTASTQLLPVLSPWAVLPQSPLRASTQM